MSYRESIHHKYTLAVKLYNKEHIGGVKPQDFVYSTVDALVFPLLSQEEKDFIVSYGMYSETNYKTLHLLIEEEQIEEILLK